METLVLGDGLLGKEIVRQTGWDYISRKRDWFDITKWYDDAGIDEYDQIVNCVAFTKTYSDDKEKHWEVNYDSVCRLVDYCNENFLKLIQISTDFVYGNNKINRTPDEEAVPVHAENWYSYTKLLGDAYVQLRADKYLLIRTSFKPNPFPYPKAYVNLTGCFDYVDVISSLIIELINKGAEGLYNVGTEKKTMYQLAKRTNEDVEMIWGKMHPSTPEDTTIDTKKMERFLNEN